MKLKILVISCFLVQHLISFSQEQDSTINWDIFTMSLEELMNINITSTSKNITSLRESPGIVSVITESEIKNSGARDLIDILNLVPGIDFGAEWDGIIGIGIRGNNATEGKFLILVDGIQLNETNFGIFPFGQHISTEQIKKIEIVRGPGSVVYGGSAELAVINIISKKGNDLNGIEINSDYAYSENNTRQYNFNANYGKKLKNGFIFNMGAFYNHANRSNRTITTLDSTIINYQDSSAIDKFNINANLNYKSLNIQFIYDQYFTNNTEALGNVLFEGVYTGIDYKVDLSEKISLKPMITWLHQKPWYFVNFESKEFYNSVNDRIDVDLTLDYKINNQFNLISGVEYINDKSKKVTDTIVFNLNNKDYINFNNFSIFSELLFKSKIINVNIGARYDFNNKYGDAFVPRIALTKAFKKFHFKALYSQAFKAPTISNIDYNSDIKPERTTVLELETGFQITKNMNFTINLFDIAIKDPILYIPNPITGADYYTNFDKTGSRGFEILYKVKPRWGYLYLAYSYYEKVDNKVEFYDIEGKPKTYGAFPRHKASINSNLKISKNINFNYTILFFGNRYTYIHSDKNWNNTELIEYNNALIFNLYITYNNLLIKNLNLSGGIYDLTNYKYEYINAYKGGQNPIPNAGREISIRLSYKI